MPYYVSIAEIEHRYHESIVNRDADVDQDGELDTTRVPAAIFDSEAEANSYVAVVHPLPLPDVTDREDPENNPAVPPELRRVVIDIVMYRLVPEHDLLTKERRKRYDDALAWLRMLAAGDVQLTLPGLPAASTPTVHAARRVMTRRKLDGLL